MKHNLRGVLRVLLGLILAAPALALGGSPKRASDAEIIHALNRLGYGPRPGDVETVRSMGLSKWIDAQLHPDRIPDEDVTSRLASLKTVRMSSADLMKGYQPPPELQREIAKKRAELGEGASEQEIEKARQELMQQYGAKMEGKPQDVIDDLQQAKLLRAIYSSRQLNEVLVDFWMNHFNVYANKGPDKFMLGEYERDVIRPHAWGKFEDLLRATAESPAMLFYLDNWLSSDPRAPLGGPGFGLRPRFEAMRRQAANRPKRGLNENYAREIMELHTLGVDGGYTQKDVTEVARCLTGWTIKAVREKPEFIFNERAHDRGDKVVLGQIINAGGKDEGDKVIHMLATQPATAHFVCLKLARRFVADDPPKALVDRAAQTFRTTDGDIRAVVTMMITSAEFNAPEARSAKIKTPLEFVVSAVRASGAQVDDARGLARRTAEMGMPLYLQQPPTGYKDTADAWVSTSGLLSRLNFALDLAAGRLRGVTVKPDALAPTALDNKALAASLAAQLLPQGLSEATRRTIAEESASNLNPAKVAGLVLGSPEFQRR